MYIIPQLKAVVTEFKNAYAAHEHGQKGVFSNRQILNLQTRCIAAIERASGSNSVYIQQIKDIGNQKLYPLTRLSRNVGVAEALLSDIENNFTSTFEELTHANVFSDFLEMAEYLLENGYKDAAAVLAGSSLEVHLRNLCVKHGIASTSNGKPKKADLLNAELTKGKVYAKLDQKQVTAWLGLRNHAAHGEYDKYAKERVHSLVDGIRNFIRRYPA